MSLFGQEFDTPTDVCIAVRRRRELYDVTRTPVLHRPWRIPLVYHHGSPAERWRREVRSLTISGSGASVSALVASGPWSAGRRALQRR